MIKNLPSALPYLDSKPVGAADFYFAINATFRFIRSRLGEEGLRRFWRDLGDRYFRPVSDQWRDGGLPAVACYWKDFFAAEPGGNVEIDESSDEVELAVSLCPAIAHLRANNREIDPAFCQHCYFVSEAMAAHAKLTVRIEGGNGTCRQRFFAANPQTPPQDLGCITSCS
jgi:hypothetical protein